LRDPARTVAKMAERTLQIYGEVMGCAIGRHKIVRNPDSGIRSARYGGVIGADSRGTAGSVAARNAFVAPAR